MPQAGLRQSANSPLSLTCSLYVGVTHVNILSTKYFFNYGAKLRQSVGNEDPWDLYRHMAGSLTLGSSRKYAAL